MSTPQDHIAAKAAEMAEFALSNQPVADYRKMDRSVYYLKREINKLPSVRFQRELILAVRVAMLNSMEKHRLKCKELPCRREKHYEDLKFAMLAELDARTPGGVYLADLPPSQISGLEVKFKEILDAVQDGNERQLEASGLVLNAIEGVRELLQDTGTKNTNTVPMIFKYLGLQITDKAIEDKVAVPLLKDIGKALGIDLG